MNRTLKALLAIAIVLSSVQICALAIDLLQPQGENAPNLLSGFTAEAELRWTAYCIGALAALALGFTLRRQQRLAGDSMVIAGVYMMLLANNGGLFASGHEQYRLVTSVLTLAFLLLLAIKGEGPASADAR